MRAFFSTVSLLTFSIAAMMFFGVDAFRAIVEMIPGTAAFPADTGLRPFITAFMIIASMTLPVALGVTGFVIGIKRLCRN